MHKFFAWILLSFVVACASPQPRPDEGARREAGLVSPFASSVPGTLITNVHLVDSAEGRVYRGMRIRDEADAKNLVETLGMSDVLIFRAASKGVGVDEEIELLATQGIRGASVTHIPFEWKAIPSFKAACLQSLDALKVMRRSVTTPGKSLFLHCTVGEDRTGYIAALYKMIYQNLDADEAFTREMCARGYADGNPGKPAEVVLQIHSNITPVFLKMKRLVATRKADLLRLDERVCEQDPLVNDRTFAATYALELARHRCVVE